MQNSDTPKTFPLWCTECCRYCMVANLRRGALAFPRLQLHLRVSLFRVLFKKERKKNLLRHGDSNPGLLSESQVF